MHCQTELPILTTNVDPKMVVVIIGSMPLQSSGPWTTLNVPLTRSDKFRCQFLQNCRFELPIPFRRHNAGVSHCGFCSPWFSLLKAPHNPGAIQPNPKGVSKFRLWPSASCERSCFAPTFPFDQPPVAAIKGNLCQPSS